MKTPLTYNNTSKSWVELNAWATCNDPTWNRVRQEAEAMGWTEVEMLRQMSYRLLACMVDAQNRAVEQYMKAFAHITVTQENGVTVLR